MVNLTQFYHLSASEQTALLDGPVLDLPFGLEPNFLDPPNHNGFTVDPEVLVEVGEDYEVEVKLCNLT
ncbi:hypothetical protein HYALB_00003580 [Hymenoscyphus albidus]|uniref:Uncharacterized protein n=1 Tax=Hymenoscyphus albidus TaxID=595503 RepID=A0A9N9M4M5_9HELO|nr:hypothetical protein HYALB_00003580 [Hymenoscyphus albidus]